MKNYNIKICKICKKEFKPNSGVQKFCSKNCFSKAKKIYQQKYYEFNSQKRKEYDKKYHKQYRKLHREELKKNKREYYLKYKDKILIKYSEYRKNHKEEIKQYRLEHKKERTEYGNRYDKNRRKTDVNFRLAHYLRCRISKVLRDNRKSDSTTKLLGCSIEQLKWYFASKFTKGMSWAKVMNGEIHIDHIKPCAAFDLSKESEQRKCFHYTNLQPLWAKDNLSKGSKFCNL